MSKSRIIVALDFDHIDSVRSFVQQINPKQCRLKVASTLFTRYGPAIVEELMSKGFDIFLDLKFHDIPQQVAQAVTSAAQLGIWMLTVHASGGVAMLKAATNALTKLPTAKRPLIVAVTVLTSLNQNDLRSLAIQEDVQNLVVRLTNLALDCGLDGVVCSAQEAALLRSAIDRPCLLVTPGIRLSQDDHNDQQRVMTPQQALAQGVDYLVIGRPITQSRNPSDRLSTLMQL